MTWRRLVRIKIPYSNQGEVGGMRGGGGGGGGGVEAKGKECAHSARMSKCCHSKMKCKQNDQTIGY